MQYTIHTKYAMMCVVEIYSSCITMDLYDTEITQYETNRVVMYFVLYVSYLLLDEVYLRNGTKAYVISLAQNNSWFIYHCNSPWIGNISLCHNIRVMDCRLFGNTPLFVPMPTNHQLGKIRTNYSVIIRKNTI